MRASHSLTKQNYMRRAKFILLFIIISSMYIWAFAGIQYSGLLDSAWPVTKSIISGFVSPDLEYIYNREGEDLLRGLVETLAIAVVGIALSVVLAVPIGLWAARNLSSRYYLSSSGKVSLSFLRTLPDIVLALLFIKVVGPGAFAGMLALGIGAIGMLGKLYAEEVEGMDPGPVEAIIAVGGNKWQQLAFGVIPQVVPGFISATLYRFEINMRSAATLGVIGAGGIGTPLIFSIQSRNWERVGIILIGIVIVVLIVDLLSSYLRKKIV
ncbi:phosphonate ABC transporter, permease protein PhnE [Salipaludibacillus agaradhaerens]|uniref:phosphonate ABC transporter, permease protein PhnE n=1 Tax=Salipaludibacillus agaradhaerens TaxID=76935 RepID=UPI000996FA8D|nr:phosphonate ABC transporter, permease protein PhnE [Salipaludibacillus agaradhaerens]